MNLLYSLLVFILFSISYSSYAASDISLRDKIGQMLVVGFDGKKINSQSPVVKSIEKNNIGGVILFDFDSRTKTYDKNIESPEQVKQLNEDLQYVTLQANATYHRPQLPLLISVDYEGGEVNRLDEQYGFPRVDSAAVIGQGSFANAEVSAESMAKTMVTSGFNLNFAPVLDVNVNPDNPIIGKLDRSFSNDPHLVSRFGNIYSQYFLKHKVQCAYKHFPGHGSSTNDSHLGFVDVTDTWSDFELDPFRELLKGTHACGMVMSAHIVNRQLDKSGLPATLSHQILTELLRTQLNFKGVIITDDMQMKAISDNYSLEQALVLAINAGADMLIFGNNLTVEPQNTEEVINLIESNVLSGVIPLERINDAYEHIVTLKKTL